MDIKQLFYTYTENIAHSLGCDTTFSEENMFVCYILRRDENGSIIRNYFHYALDYLESHGTGRVQFFQGNIPFETLSFRLDNPEELPQIFMAIDQYTKKALQDAAEEDYLGR